MNFIKDFVEQAERRPEAPALIHEGRTYSYGELMEQIDGCGRALKEIGVKPGDRVALMMNNRPEFAVVYNATIKIGANAAIASFDGRTMVPADFKTRLAAFEKDGSVTAGNAPGLNDGGAALVVAGVLATTPGKSASHQPVVM